MTTTALFQTARQGDRVTITLPERRGIPAQQRTGRVIMKFDTHLVLNLGGRHGTPGIADDRNTVRVSPAR